MGLNGVKTIKACFRDVAPDDRGIHIHISVLILRENIYSGYLAPHEIYILFQTPVLFSQFFFFFVIVIVNREVLYKTKSNTIIQTQNQDNVTYDLVTCKIQFLTLTL